ncbi:MAG: glycogen debranching protein GlgX [Steroidobacteraceae bacterium]
MIRAGQSYPLGAHCIDGGVNFAVYSGVATRVELCLFDASGRESRFDLPACDHGVWHGFLADCHAGQLYGYRVHGPFEPTRGHWCNPRKLLIDPYAKKLSGALRWHVTHQPCQVPNRPFIMDATDSGPYMAKAIVTDDTLANAVRSTRARNERVVYEIHPRGFTMLHPDVPVGDRGLLRGLRNGQVLDYLRVLGITTLELMPIQAFYDEEFLARQGMHNYWGYSPLAFQAVEPRYLGPDGPGELGDLIRAAHERNLEVVLDVVLNHTAEGDSRGPLIGLRGFDNAAYYRLDSQDGSKYLNYTGCGNTLNVDHPRVVQLLLDSLRHWVLTYGVDGFRFDLATTLGRSNTAFVPTAPLLTALDQDPVLCRCIRIAEPWDVGPQGYRLGGFPAAWSEWNDRFRDSVRRFWRGDAGEAAEFARRLHGSADLFESSGRQPTASLNFVTCHDGMTVADLVSYNHKHNDANGENNRDGHNENFSQNHGIEGDTDDPVIATLRRKQRLNLLFSTILASGTPMLLAGDEIGHSQRGNNNAYAQDNELAWINWSRLGATGDHVAAVSAALAVRKAHAVIRRDFYAHGGPSCLDGYRDIDWLGANAEPVDGQFWQSTRQLLLLLAPQRPEEGAAVAMAFNTGEAGTVQRLPPAPPACKWRCLLCSGTELPQIDRDTGHWPLEPRSTTVWALEPD